MKKDYYEYFKSLDERKKVIHFLIFKNIINKEIINQFEKDILLGFISNKIKDDILNISEIVINRIDLIETKLNNINDERVERTYILINTILEDEFYLFIDMNKLIKDDDYDVEIVYKGLINRLYKIIDLFINDLRNSV